MTVTPFNISLYSINMEVIDSDTNSKPSRSNTSTATTDRPMSKGRKAEDAASTPPADKILYGVEECPPWYLCALLGLQVRTVKSAIKSQIPY